MSRVRHVVLVCLAALALGAGCGPEPRAAPEVRNPRAPILLLVLDAASAGYFGVYGDPHDTSPRIDRLARDSVVFTRAYSQTATTTPTVASLLTGTSPVTHGLGMAEARMLSPRLGTLAQTAAFGGYCTAIFSSNGSSSSSRPESIRLPSLRFAIGPKAIG